MEHKHIEVDGLTVFYREAGEARLPKVVLLHGFPASSHQYRNLMPALSEYFHVVAPDYPGFGNSALPDPQAHAYTFERMSEIVESFLAKIGFEDFGLYVQDYGGPVGFRIITRRPDWLQWLIVQNANAYEAGFAPEWDSLRRRYWEDRNPATEKPLEAFLHREMIRRMYVHGHTYPERISPDNWNMDLHFLERPGARRVQLELFHDDRSNVALYSEWQAFLRERQPKTIIFWGQHDMLFSPAGGESYLDDLPDADMHRLMSGHFALEDCLPYIAVEMTAFHRRAVRKAR